MHTPITSFIDAIINNVKLDLNSSILWNIYFSYFQESFLWFKIQIVIVKSVIAS